MNACRDCGQPVRFLLLGTKDDGANHWTLPLDSEARIVVQRPDSPDEPFAHQGYAQTETFTLHDCPESRQAKIVKDEQAVMRQVRARQTDEAWTEALKRVCPRCEVPRDVRCLNLTDVRLGRAPAHTRHPHADRLPFGWAERNET